MASSRADKCLVNQGVSIICRVYGASERWLITNGGERTPVINVDAERLWVRAIGDKLLVGGKVRYSLFFEADRPFDIGPADYSFSTFKTPNGFHAVGFQLSDAEGKRKWFEAWRELYPESDYKMANWNWLRPHTREEARFILRRSREEPQTCRYYRDKAVLETWLARSG